MVIYWLVVWNMNFIFPYIGNVIIPNWRTPWFFRGVGQPPTRTWWTRLRVHVRSAAISYLIPLPCHAKPGTWLQGCRTCQTCQIWRFLTANWTQQKDPVDPRHDFGGDGGSGSTPRAQEVWKLRLGQLGCHPWHSWISKDVEIAELPNIYIILKYDDFIKLAMPWYAIVGW